MRENGRGRESEGVGTRGRERSRGDYRVRGRVREWIYPRRSSRGFLPKHRLSPSRGPRRQESGRFFQKDLRAGTGTASDHINLSKHPVTFKGGNDDKWEAQKSRGQAADTGGFPLKKPFTRSFRDLFSDEDINNGGKWQEVRRKKVVRARARSPIIKNPCYRCGLSGHLRYNCPKKLNMRCYGCNSTSHLIRDCPVVQRPEMAEVEIKPVYDITERVKSLSKFAIFRAKGSVNILSLKAALSGKLWEGSWQGKIIPFEKNSFLVEFYSEIQRDMAVIVGKLAVGDSSGTFYEWNENYGAMRVLRPVLVWITLIGLPWQCWGKEEIKAVVGSFGKLHKLGVNFYKKDRADVLRVMVAVDDISLVPKTIHCSYKAITDERVRVYPVHLRPAMVCLPVSQWNDANYESYAEEGVSGDRVEQDWSGEVWARRAERKKAAFQEEEDEGEEVTGRYQNRADLGEARPEEARAEDPAGGGEFRGGANRATDLVAAELERRRKGKNVQVQTQSPVRPTPITGRVGVEEDLLTQSLGRGQAGLDGRSGVGPSMGRGLVGPGGVGPGAVSGPLSRGNVVGPSVGPSVELIRGGQAGLRPDGLAQGPLVGGNNLESQAQDSSGSGSCDPMEFREQADEGMALSDAADSHIGSGPRDGTVKEKPIVISGGTEEDLDLGGEALGDKDDGVSPKVPKVEKVVSTEERRGMDQEVGKERDASVDGTGAGAGVGYACGQAGVGYAGGQAKEGGSRGSAGSIPPGFRHLKGSRAKGVPVVSSPFGKIQRGGFKFLKRSASSSSSGSKAGKTPAKKTRPLSTMPDKEVADVASNVGIAGQLSQQQIAGLKAREKDQASS